METELLRLQREVTAKLKSLSEKGAHKIPEQGEHSFRLNVEDKTVSLNRLKPLFQGAHVPGKKSECRIRVNVRQSASISAGQNYMAERWPIPATQSC